MVMRKEGYYAVHSIRCWMLSSYPLVDDSNLLGNLARSIVCRFFYPRNCHLTQLGMQQRVIRMFTQQPLTLKRPSVEGKYWGIWLPVPTFLAVINSLFWLWVISRTVGLAEPPKTTESENAVIEQF